MREPVSQLFLDEAFERIEGAILPCIGMLLDTLIDSVSDPSGCDPKQIAAEIRTLAAELDDLTQAVERVSPLPARDRIGRLAFG